ncbi:MAG TPA: hypothetical protein VNA14_12525 [Mycobacteriales bacterium]|nr:hypothetical protein [Mycobacteriales bacterium]
MRWPWRRRARGGRVVFIGTSPFDVRAAIDSVPTPSPVVSAWIPDEPAQYPAPPPATPAVAAPAAPPAAPAAAPAEVPAPRTGVQLGFADGTVMTLDDDDPRAVALRNAAKKLTGTS